jgi:hypothetical protein
MPTLVASRFNFLIGLAAAGTSEFQRGDAGFPVADTFSIRFVLFTACTGVFIDTPLSKGGNCFIVVGFVVCLFWHCVYLGGTVARTIITHMRIII